MTIPDSQCTIKDVVTRRCRLWKQCDYHTCSPDCAGYHDPLKHPNIDIERD